MSTNEVSSAGKRRFLIYGSLVAILVAICGTIAVVVVLKHRAPLSAEELYQKGMVRMTNNNPLNAFRFFREAAERDPAQAKYFVEAARAAGGIGNRSEAQWYAQIAWEKGIKTPEMLELIVDGFEKERPAEKKESLEKAMALLQQLPQSQERQILRGDILYFFSDPQQGLEIWLQAIEEGGPASLITKAARAYMAQREVAKAKNLLTEHRQKDHLDASGYRLLAAIYTVEGAMQEALQTFQEAKEKGYTDDNIKLEHAIFHLINQEPDKAKPLLSELHEPAQEDPRSALLHAHARIYLGYIHLSQTNRAGLKELENIVGDLPPSSWKEGEQFYYQALHGLLDHTPNALQALNKARRLIPNHAILETLFAQKSMEQGEYGDAIVAYRSVGGVMSRWPVLLFGLAKALHKNGQDQEALQVLSQLHARNVYSKESVQLFRNISFDRNLPEVAEASQRFLENQYPEDPGIQMFSGFQALRQGAFSKAQEIFDQLISKYPEDVRFELARIQTLAAEEKYQQALEACRQSEASAGQIAPLEALIHLRMGNVAQAEQAFQTAIRQVQSSPFIHVEYGKLLWEQGKMQQAEQQFRTALEKNEQLGDAHIGLARVAYERKNWDLARQHLEKAIEVQPDSGFSHLIYASLESEMNNLDKALTQAQLALNKDPDLQEAILLRGNIRLKQGQTDNAAQDFQSVLQANPNHPYANLQMAIVQRRQGNFQQSLERLATVENAFPNDPMVRVLKMENLALGGKRQEAHDLFNQLKGSLPSAQGAVYEAWFAELDGDTEKAKQLLENHLEHPQAATQWATLVLKQGKEANVIERLHQHQLKLQDWVSLATLAEQHSLYAAASFFYQRALNLNPDNPVLLNNWAWNTMHLPVYDTEKVLDACRKASNAAPGNRDILDTYAEALLRADRHDDCVKLLTDHFTLTSRTPQLLSLLGQAYQGKQDLNRALDAYTRSRDLQQSQDTAWNLRMSAEEMERRIRELQQKVN